MAALPYATCARARDSVSVRAYSCGRYVRETLRPDEDVDALLVALEEDDEVSARLREERVRELQHRCGSRPCVYVCVCHAAAQ
jgi:hypothetical protein